MRVCVCAGLAGYSELEFPLKCRPRTHDRTGSGVHTMQYGYLFLEGSTGFSADAIIVFLPGGILSFPGSYTSPIFVWTGNVLLISLGTTEPRLPGHSIVFFWFTAMLWTP